MKLKIFLLFFAIYCSSLGARGQNVAIKTNLLYDAATTLNLGVEVGLNPRWTLELLGAYNPWTFSDDRKMRLWMVQPEAKYWFCERFEGHFVGLHTHAAQFYGGFHSKRYDGYLAGGGFTYGYNWILSPHFNLEAAIGLGYAYIWYKESPRINCIKCQENKDMHYVGPTKVALSLIYLF